MCFFSSKNYFKGISQRLAFVRKNTRQFLFSYLGLVIRKGDWTEVSRVRKKIRKSRFQENIESEKSSLFYLNKENKNYQKSSLHSLKINQQITQDKTKIEEEVIKYFGALFNGHHNRDGEDTCLPFVPDNADKFLGESSQVKSDK